MLSRNTMYSRTLCPTITFSPSSAPWNSSAAVGSVCLVHAVLLEHPAVHESCAKKLSSLRALDVFWVLPHSLRRDRTAIKCVSHLHQTWKCLLKIKWRYTKFLILNNIVFTKWLSYSWAIPQNRTVRYFYLFVCIHRFGIGMSAALNWLYQRLPSVLCLIKIFIIVLGQRNNYSSID